MTAPFEALLAVQEHDTRIDQLLHRQRTLPERAALEEVRSRRSALGARMDELQREIDELGHRQLALEEQIGAAASRRHELDRRMLSGAVTAARDLQAMDAEVAHLAERQAQLEADELALLEAQEPLESALGEARTEDAALAAEVERLQAAVDAAVTALAEEVVAVREARWAVAADVPEPLLIRYEELRDHLGGVGVARLVGDRCDGCHLTLPSMEAERIRRLAPTELATCEQCGRLLVH